MIKKLIAEVLCVAAGVALAFGLALALERHTDLEWAARCEAGTAAPKYCPKETE